MKTKVILIAIFFLAFLLRFYRIESNPPGLYIDEVSIAYNAYSINATGEDEWGNAYPLTFKAFGDYKLPVYVYLASLSQRIFGLNDFSLRVPSALIGTLTVIILYHLVIHLVSRNKQKTALLSAFLLAISLWHLQFSRAGFEANVALFFISCGVFLFFQGLKKKPWRLVFSMVFFALSFYTYHSASLVAPMIIFILILIYRRQILETKKELIMSLVVFLLLVLPYLPSYLTSATGRLNITNESVMSEKGNLLTNLSENFLASFSTDYLFFKGDQNGRHSIKKMGELYLWQLPATLLALYIFAKRKDKWGVFLVSWVLLAAIPPTITRVSPHALRNLLAVVPWQIVSAIGLVLILSKCKKRFILMSFIFLIPIVYSLASYLHNYYLHYPISYAADWQDGQKTTLTYLHNIESNYAKIYLYKSIPPVSVLWYSRYDPKLLQASGHDLTSIGKYRFDDLGKSPPKTSPSEKDLIVTPEWMGVNQSLKLLKDTYLNNGEIAFRIYEY